MPLRLERRQGVATERELAVTAALRGSQMTAPVAAPHHQPAGDQVNVVPPQRPELADAEPGAQRQGEHRPPLRVGSVEEPLGFLEAEEVELRLRPFEPRYRGHGEQGTLDPNWTPRFVFLRCAMENSRIAHRSRMKSKRWERKEVWWSSLNRQVQNCQGEDRRFEPGVPLQFQGSGFPLARDLPQSFRSTPLMATTRSFTRQLR